MLISSYQGQSSDLIFKHGFENTALVAGVVTGLSSTGLELKLSFNATSQIQVIAENGIFIFSQNVDVGASWEVVIENQPNNPTPQTCTLSNATGVMTISGISNVQVSCTNTLNNWDEMNWDEGSWN